MISSTHSARYLFILPLLLVIAYLIYASFRRDR